MKILTILYITESGIRAGIQDNQFVVLTQDGLKKSIPIQKLEAVVVISKCTLSSSCICQLLNLGIPVTYISSKGLFYGRLESTRHVNIARQRKQFRCGESHEFCLQIAKKIIAAKIHNQIVILKRYAKNNLNLSVQVQPELEKMAQSQYKITDCKDIEQILGHEGVASRIYYQVLSLFIDPIYEFKGRNRMPPKDPVNSLLSFGYTLLLYEIYTVLTSKGLNPYAGFIHKDRQGHPSLASDIIEEWRAIIVDSLVLKLIRSYKFALNDFQKDSETGGVYLDKKLSKQFIQEFEDKLKTEAGYGINLGSGSNFRRIIQHQAGLICSAIDNENPDLFIPLKIK